MKRILIFAAAAILFAAAPVYAYDEPVPEAAEEPIDPNEESADYVFTFYAEDGEYIAVYYDKETGGFMGSEISVNLLDPVFPELNGGTGVYYSSAEDIPIKNSEIVETVGEDGDPWRKFYVLSADMNDPYAYYAGHEVYENNTGGENGYFTTSPVSGNTSLSALSAAAACALGVSLFTSKKREYGRKNCKK
ncbi:MAG: hypothetical protein NC120_02915 [Ruminococcus sp.]|nr:hypothetical protein [Ruminococcus sp.]